MLVKPGKLIIPAKGAGVSVADFDTDYQAILSRADALGYTKPSFKNQIDQNALVLSLKGVGAWAKLDVLYVFANDGSAEFATLNWISPSTLQLSLVNSPTFTSGSGFRSDGSTSFLSSTYNPATFGGQRALNNASVMAWVEGPTGTTAPICGASTTNADGLVALTTTTTALSRLHNGTTSLPSPAQINQQGFQLLNRTNSSTLTIYSGSLAQQSRTVTSTSILSQTMAHLKRGTTFTRSDVTVRLTASGASLDAEASSVRIALTTYMDSL